MSEKQFSFRFGLARLFGPLEPKVVRWQQLLAINSHVFTNTPLNFVFIFFF